MTSDNSQSRSTSLRKGISVLSREGQAKPSEKCREVKKIAPNTTNCGMCGVKNYDIKKEIEIVLVAKKQEEFQNLT